MNTFKLYLLGIACILSFIVLVTYLYILYKDSQVKDTNPKYDYYPFYIAPPKKGMSAKIHGFEGFNLYYYSSIADAAFKTGISRDKIKELISSGEEYSNFKFKQLKY